MDRTGNGYQTLMESTRELSPIPHANASVHQLETSSITLGSASETGHDEGIPMTAEWSDESRDLKRGRDSSDDVVNHHPIEGPNPSMRSARNPGETCSGGPNDLTTNAASGASKSVLPGSNLPGISGAKRQRTEMESAALNRVETLRRELEAARLLEARMRHKHEMELADKDAELEKIKRRLKLTMTEESETQANYRRAKTELFELRQAQDSLRLEFDAALQNKDDHVEELQDHLRSKEEAFKRAEIEAQQKISSLEEKLALVAAQAEPSSLRSSVVQSEVRLLREQLAEKTILATNAMERLKAADETIKEANDIRELRRRLDELERAEGKHLEELRHLRHQLKSHAALEEKVASLYRAQELSEQQLQEAFAIRAVHDDLVEEQKQWKAVFEPVFADPKKGISEKLAAEHPAKAICQLFAIQQHDLETLIDERHQLERQVQSLQSTVDAMTKEQLTLQSTIAQLEATDADRMEKMNVTARSASRLQNTNSDLITLLKSFEATGGGSDDQLALVQQLETSLKNAEETIATLQVTQQTLPSPALLAKTKGRVTELEEALRQEKMTSLQLQAHLEQVQANAALVERRLAKGAVNQDSTKVLPLSTNPMSASKSKLETAEMAELRRENERLKEIVQNVNVQTPGPKTILPTPMKSASTSHDTIEGLQKMNQRLKEVFREQIAKYRDAVYQCTGYKVDLKYPELLLRSIYAENEGDEIKFQFNNGELELLETPFVAGLDQRNMAYLTICNSIPAFLSGVTLALFEKQTYQGN
ncbi:hypothetical protein H310_06845 [Aphanomyces invadans]|uniref:Spindle assembly checkpoint component MAD1 n=1 Tax=Aphanomyces invadans TaxID=157072 RepID=A0A024U4U0_9STRA|nr:hypothetical protein H310_06845 [Aphanomyces invadans]ETW01274.1 hypothetical protein H310_06845 [Aphanomyces invadans]|eukprot:XP_008870272.1 hypothetical protein H310_06845 [Aphanomyces invadans]